jgi:hypothetical protein
MWDRLTCNYIKRYQNKLQQMQPGERARLQALVGEEVSNFLDTIALTEKSLRQLELRIDMIMNHNEQTTDDAPQERQL